MFRLALALGMTVDELGERMTSAEFAEWMAYYAIEPFGEERADLRMGILATVVAKTGGAKGRLSPDDFMPRFASYRRRAPASKIRADVQRAAAAARRLNHAQ